MTPAERQVLHAATAALVEHGLYDQGWRAKLDNAKKRLGYSHAAKKLISFSRPYIRLNGLAGMADTVLHEVAHALTPKDRGHGPAWRATARKIGAKPERCNGDAVSPAGKYVADCSCGNEHARFKRPPAPGTRRCRASRDFLTWRLRGRPPVPVVEIVVEREAIAASVPERRESPAGVTGKQRRLF